MKTKRINLTLPSSLYDDLVYVSRRLGLSASALLCQISREGITHMSLVLHQVPETGGSDAIVKRLRGESVAHIEHLYAETMDMLGVHHDKR